VFLPSDLHSAAVFDLHIPCSSHAVPLPCHEYAFLEATSQGHGRVVAVLRQGDVMRRYIGGMPAFGLFLLPCSVPVSLLSEASQSQMQVASVKQSNVCLGREEAYYFSERI
jgi:hypothetical protein